MTAPAKITYTDQSGVETDADDIGTEIDEMLADREITFVCGSDGHRYLVNVAVSFVRVDADSKNDDIKIIPQGDPKEYSEWLRPKGGRLLHAFRKTGTGVPMSLCGLSFTSEIFFKADSKYKKKCDGCKNAPKPVKK